MTIKFCFWRKKCIWSIYLSYLKNIAVKPSKRLSDHPLDSFFFLPMQVNFRHSAFFNFQAWTVSSKTPETCKLPFFDMKAHFCRFGSGVFILGNWRKHPKFWLYIWRFSPQNIIWLAKKLHPNINFDIWNLLQVKNCRKWLELPLQLSVNIRKADKKGFCLCL